LIKLIIDNVYIKIENIEKSAEMAIWNHLSFEIEEFAQEYTRVRHLYNRKTKKTYTGLLPHIEEILNGLGEDYEIIDNRVKHEPNANFKLVDKIILPDGNEQYLKLRPYQEEVVNRATEREVVQIATGGGKTFVMAALIEKYNVKPVSVFADKLSLCSQIKDEFEKFLGVPVGLVGGGINKKEDITVYSIQSATEEDVKDSKMILFDECLIGDTLITLSDNSIKTIKEIVENKLECEVITYNTEKKIFENNKIYDWQKIPFESKNKKIVKLTIEDENGIEHVIECTEDHKVWIESENKYIEAGKLTSGMEVICKKRRSE